MSPIDSHWRQRSQLDDSQDAHRDDASAASSTTFAQLLMVLDPVDLFRFTVLSTSPTLHERAKLALGDGDPGWALICAAWLAWHHADRFRTTAISSG